MKFGKEPENPLKIHGIITKNAELANPEPVTIKGIVKQDGHYDINFEQTL